MENPKHITIKTPFNLYNLPYTERLFSAITAILNDDYDGEDKPGALIFDLDKSTVILPRRLVTMSEITIS